MEAHVKRVHEGQKPYSCNLCHETFTKKDLLNQHKNNDHEDSITKDINISQNIQNSSSNFHRKNELLLVSVPKVKDSSEVGTSSTEISLDSEQILSISENFRNKNCDENNSTLNTTCTTDVDIRNSINNVSTNELNDSLIASHSSNFSNFPMYHKM